MTLRLPIIRICLGALLLGLLPMSGIGQDFNDYQPLTASGELPEDFLLSSRQKYLNEMENVSGAETRKERKAKAEFFEESAYFMNQLLLSGKVLFNDPLTGYVNKVADYLLRDQAELRKALRFYVVKSPSANAFSTNDGLILVNVGLLSKLENEAQLAFILAHEVSHYIKKHPLDIFLQTKRASRSRKIFGGGILEDAFLAKNNYTREKEQEADAAGWEIYVRSGYDLEAAASAFEVLKYAHLPFGNEKVSLDFLESEYLIFPKGYLPEEITPIKDKYEDLDPSRSTHPNPDVRKEIILKKMKGLDNSGKKLFEIGETKFKNVQAMSRFERTHLLLVNRRYESAIYGAYLLLQDYPESIFLKKIIGHALYTLSEYANQGRLWDIHEPFEDIEGHSQAIYFLAETLTDKELNITALAYVWNLHLQKPQDEELRMMAKDLMFSLGKNYVQDMDFFLRTLPADTADKDEHAFIKYALGGFFQDATFEETLSKQLAAGAEAKSNIERARRKPRKRKQKELSLEGFNLGLDKVVFVEPFYKRIDQRKETNVQYLDSEKSKKELVFSLRKHAKLVELEHEVVESNNLKPGDINTFKDLVLLNNWINEKSSHDEMNLVSINHEEVQYLKEKYGTSHFVWTGALSLTTARQNKGFTIAAGIVFPPAFPLALYTVFSPQFDTFIYTMVYDIESGKYLILYPKHIGMKDKPDVLNSALYDLIYQIKTP